MFMSAKAVANYLKAQGYNVVSLQEGDDMVDGMVKINDRIHVHVGMFEPYIGVHLETNDGSFLAYPIRMKLTDMEADLKKALDNLSEESIEE